MSVLLKEIRKLNPSAASVLEDAELCSDLDIQALSREDLRDLFPQTRRFKLRKQIFELINQRKTISLLLTEMKGFIPDESLRAALSGNGVLVEYLKILKDMKTQVNSLQAFLDAHIDLLENIGKNRAALEPNRGASPSTSRSFTYGPAEPYKFQNTSHTPRYWQGTGRVEQSPKQTFCLPQVKCMFVVAGTTFDAHLQLMEKVKRIQDPNLDLVCLSPAESHQDYQVIIVFCPISSRIGTDVEAAMNRVTGDKPVILVLMDHTREAKNTNPKRTWGDYSNVVLQVYVYYHDTMRGLLNCHQNDGAASEIQKKLLEYSIKMIQGTGNTEGMAADRAGVSVRGGGSDSGSNVESGSLFNRFLGFGRN